MQGIHQFLHTVLAHMNKTTTFREELARSSTSEVHQHFKGKLSLKLTDYIPCGP